MAFSSSLIINDRPLLSPPSKASYSHHDTVPEEQGIEISEKVFTCGYGAEPSINTTAWKRYLTSRVQTFLDSASDYIPPGEYWVHVRFRVRKDGSLTDIKAMDDPGFDLAKFAETVIRKGPGWNPGQQSRLSYHTQPIAFIITEDEQDTVTQPETYLWPYSCSPVITEACIDSVLWQNYIDQRTRVVVESMSNRIPAGTYKVETLFLIEKNGNISDVRIRKGCRPDLDSLAKEIIRKAPDWEPSTRNGKFTRTYKKQIITFNIQGQDCKNGLKDNSIL